MRKLQLNYFPTTAMLLDDREAFLNGIALNLKEDILHVLHTDAAAALEKIKQDVALLTNLSTSKTIDDLLTQPNRYQNISVALVDYVMPSMDGLEFCREIKDLPVKRVIMTGNVDLKPIERAMQEGFVDLMISKSEPGFLEKLDAVIRESEKEFCDNVTQHYLESQKQSAGDWAEDEVFVKFFRDWLIPNNGFVEYYLIDPRGEFLLMTRDGHISKFIVMTESELADFYKGANANPGKLNELDLKAIKQKHLMPTTFSLPKDILTDDFLTVASCVSGEQKFYWALLDTSKLTSQNLESLKTFYHYLTQFYL